MARRRKRSRIIRNGLGVAVFILLVALVAAGLWFSANLKPVSAAGETQQFEIRPGMSASQVAKELEEKNLIRNAEAFRLFCRWQEADAKINAGLYQLSPAMSAKEILAALLAGTKPEEVRVTIPEGYTVEQIVNTLVEKGLGSEKELYDAMSSIGAKDYDFLQGIPDGKNRLEGFLFPDTYFFDKKSEPREVLDRFLQRFEQEITDDVKSRLKQLDTSIYDWVTLSSVVEREAQKQEERPIIAGVFNNRLKTGMPLQSCATVLYALGEIKPVLTIEDTKIESPYNTYKYAGLPPGPIANPGHASLQAVLYPEKTEYVYFVAKPDGSHAFAVTYQEHLRNVARYQ